MHVVKMKVIMSPPGRILKEQPRTARAPVVLQPKQENAKARHPRLINRLSGTPQ
jgi:hypothetical protein